MPRKTEDYIRLDAPGEAGKHEGHKIRTRTFSKKDGIKALYCVDCKRHTVYLFSRKPPWNWTMSRAQAWLKKRKKASFADLAEDGKIIFEHFDEKGVLVEAVDQEKLKQETEKMNFDKELREDRIIFLFERIDDWTSEDICKRLLVYDKLDSEKPVKLYISSYGGGVYASFAITDMIEFIKAPVETIGIGKIMSGGLLIFMAGDKRYISQTASILSHRFSGCRMGTQAELKADQRNEELIHQRMVDHYIKFSNLEDKKEVESKLLQETNVWLTPEEVLGYELADDYFDKDWDVEEGITEAVEDTVFGEDYEHKLGGYGCMKEASGKEFRNPKSEFGYYPSVERMAEIGIFLDKLMAELDVMDDYVNALQEVKGILKHWTGQAYPVPKKYWLPDEETEAVELEEMNEALENLIASNKTETANYREILSEIKVILSRIAQGDSSYPKLHSNLEEAKDGHCVLAESEGCIMRHSFLSEPVTVDWIEEDASKPFTFRGKALMVDRRNDNNRRYKRKITERALKESRRLGKRGQVLSVMDGHPKRGDTAVTPVVGKVSFGDIGADNWMPYEAMISNTSRGMDIQKLLRDKCIGDVSLRSRGRTAVAKMDGESVEDVVDLHFKGLDLVTQGSEKGAGVEEILNAKKESDDLFEAIGGSRALPLDSSGKWDGAAAEKRMRSFAGGPDKVNWSSYQKGFVWYDAADKEKFGSYKLPFADVVGGKLTAVWGGVNAGMGAVNGARTPLKMSPVERKSAYNFLVGYYKKFDKTPPAFKGEMGGEYEMTTLEELKKNQPDLVETIRSEEKEKLNKELKKSKDETKGTKEKLVEAEDKLKEAEKAGNVSVEDYKKLKEEVVDLKAKNKLRESKEVYLKKVKEAGLTEEMTEGLEELCLGKKPEEMDEAIKTRTEFIQKISKSETIGQSEKEEEEEEDPEKKKERIDKDVKGAFE